MRPTCRLWSQFRLAPTIRQLLSSPLPATPVLVNGWIKSVRRQKRVAFAAVNDGSSDEGIQAVFLDPSKAKDLTNGTAVRLVGSLSASPGPGQSHELLVSSATVLGPCDPSTYPIQKQALSTEYLRQHLDLRVRTSAIAAMLRLRNKLIREIQAVMEDKHGFLYAHTPIFTGNDAEGAGESFRISPVQTRSTTTDQVAKTEEFFGRPGHLSVSSQLHLEALTMGIGRVYTIGPCFRAEWSNSKRHLSEFWMMEAEWVAPEGKSTVEELCSLVEDLLRQVLKHVLEDMGDDLNVLWGPRTWAFERVLEKEWPRMTYSEAIHVLTTSREQFEHKPIWGAALQTEHERYLCEEYASSPLFVTNYPQACKPFYMRSNDDKTVECFDLLIPGVGELVGGSVREDRLEKLSEIGGEDLDWYVKLREFGSAPHGGFGMGMERLVSWVGGIENVRESIAFPRTAGRMYL